MTKLYKHLTKTAALMCLLLLGGLNAWADTETWVPTVDNNNYTNLHVTIGNSTDDTYPSTEGWYQATFTDNTVNSVSVLGKKLVKDTSIKSVRFGWVQGQYNAHYTSGYIKASTDGIVTLTLQSYKESETIQIAEETTGFSIQKNGTESNNVVGAGVTFSFEMKAGKYYHIGCSSKNAVHIKKVVFTTDYIVLDENESKATNENIISAAAATNIKTILLKRTLKAGQWNTFCLPVLINATTSPTLAEQLCGVAYELTGYDSSTNKATFTAIQASNGNKIYRANTPCLIKPTEDIVDPVIIGAANVTAPTTLTKTVDNLSFIGVYGTENIYDAGKKNFFMNSEGYLLYPSSSDKGTIKGLRAYFQWVNGAPVKGLTFTFDGSETTGIKTVEYDIFGESGRVYSIDGRFVGNSTDNLTRGIYIQNGRKFVVK